MKRNFYMFNTKPLCQTFAHTLAILSLWYVFRVFRWWVYNTACSVASGAGWRAIPLSNSWAWHYNSVPSDLIFDERA